MNQTDPLLQTTRRQFFSRCGMGVGSIALASLLSKTGVHAAPQTRFGNPLAPKHPHFAPKAKNIIYLFMAGGPSQLELFDYKPKLAELSGQPIPQSYIDGKRFAFMNSSHGVKLLGTRRAFERRGQSGMWVSDLLPHTGSIVDDAAFVTTCSTKLFNHAPAKLFMNTGSELFGRPSMGSWVTYGIGSEADDLPGFVVLQSGPRGPRGGSVNWGSGFLPTTFQGVPFRGNGEPILNLGTPQTVSAGSQQRTIDAVRQMNLKRLVETGDPEIGTRIASYEMAFKMQSSAPDLIDLTDETPATLNLYGAERGKPSFATNCLLARRLVERGVRFVQLYHTNWGSHGGPGENLQEDLERVCRDVDQAGAALVKDLKTRGLLDETLVIWGGEFGRTPMGENRQKTGRNHHIDAFTMWFAGGGVQPGVIVGQTDELGFGPATSASHVHDIHATILHLLGLEHTDLTFRFQGRDFRLTDVEGNLIREMIA